MTRMVHSDLEIGFRTGILILTPVICFLFYQYGFSIELLLYSILLTLLALYSINEILGKISSNIFTNILISAGGILLILKMGDNTFLLIDSLSGMGLSGISFLCIFFITRGGLSLDNVALMSYSGMIMGLEQIMGVMFAMSIFTAASALLYLFFFKRFKAGNALPSLLYIYLGCIAVISSYQYSL